MVVTDTSGFVVGCENDRICRVNGLNSLQHVGVATAIVMCAYWLTATIGLTWAIPPGYATLVWAPAGIALGCVYVWGPRLALGVLLGSYLANVWVPSAPERAAVFLSGALPAVGATVQAIVGAYMLRRFVQAGSHILRMARCALLAAASCAINGVWGPMSLSMAGLIPPSEIQSCIWTWWVGDAIGCVVFAPLIVFLAGGKNGVR